MKMREIRTYILLLGCLLWAGAATAQYHLNEIGLNAGGGLAMLQSSEGSLSGPAWNVNGFYGHYFCGKAYGIQATIGVNSFHPSTDDGGLVVDDEEAGQTSLTLTSLDAGFYFKLKKNDYHRPKEIAVLVGLKANLPLVTRYSSQNTSGSLETGGAIVSTIVPGAHLSLQIRRPIGEMSLFIQPGAEYYVTPLFNGERAGDVNPLYLFLNVGIALWDQRG